MSELIRFDRKANLLSVHIFHLIQRSSREAEERSGVGMKERKESTRGFGRIKEQRWSTSTVECYLSMAKS